MCEELRRKVVGVGCALALLLALPASAGPNLNLLGTDVTTIYVGGFSVVENDDDDADAAALASNLFVSVGQYLDNDDYALFTFWNLGTVGAVITDIYWDASDPTVLAPPSALRTDLSSAVGSGLTSTTWDGNVSPGSVPGWATLDPKFAVHFGTDATGSNGITDGGYATFQVAMTATWADLLRELNEGDVPPGDTPVTNGLRFGLHVQSFESGASASYVSQPVVPVPGAAGIGLLGFGMVAFLRRKRAGGLA